MRYIIFSLFTSLALVTNAQSVKITNATSQSWSGGLAGHHGINYVIGLQCSDTAIMPDTAWINGQCYPIHIAKNDTMSRKADRRHNTVTYRIYEGEAWNDMDQADIARRQQNANVKKSHKNYDGAALISYMFKGIQHTVIVPMFTQLTPLCYP
jgi:hypothetical protein